MLTDNIPDHFMFRLSDAKKKKKKVKCFKGSNNRPVLNICSCWSLWSQRWQYDVFLCQTLISSSEGSERRTNMQSAHRKGSLWYRSPRAAPAWIRPWFCVKSWQKAPSTGSEQHQEMRVHPEKKKHTLIFRSTLSLLGRASELSSKGAQTWKRRPANGCGEQTSNLEDQPIEMNAINHREANLRWWYIEVYGYRTVVGSVWLSHDFVWLSHDFKYWASTWHSWVFWFQSASATLTCPVTLSLHHSKRQKYHQLLIWPSASETRAHKSRMVTLCTAILCI